jgi:hypothetical protein
MPLMYVGVAQSGRGGSMCLASQLDGRPDAQEADNNQ